MADIMERLGKIDARISEESFLTNKGLSNEVGIHVFCYDPAEEIIVREYIQHLKSNSGNRYHIVECDLYKIFLQICEEQGIIDAIPEMEAENGKEFLLDNLRYVASPEAFVEKMEYSPHEKGDILLISGIGKVYPFMRSHRILDNIQHIFADIPVLMLYPGKFDGQDLELFGRFLDAHYYRAFNLL